VLNLYALTIKEDIWQNGESLLTFLEKNKIAVKIYYDLPKTDKELCAEIQAGVTFQALYDKDNKIAQLLVPISEQMQIHILKNKDDKYVLEIIPIAYKDIVQTIAIPTQNSPSVDILEATSNYKLANEFIRAFDSSIRGKSLRKGDILSIKYKHKIRQGRYFGTPDIIGASVEVYQNVKKKDIYYIFQNPKDGRYYDDKARSLATFFFKVPLSYTRISSKFTQKRYHPILKKYRAHLGIDYAAPRGRRIYASADGKITFKGRKGGYGNTIIIRHKSGYKTLYAHMKGFSGVRRGQRVKQGKLIGYVGSTGRSTGPHLHFGLYKNGRAINPARVVSVAKTKLNGKAKKSFLNFVKKIKKELQKQAKLAKAPLNIPSFDTLYTPKIYPKKN
jgi:murein DD-endopeptidase MepM/ murein hydrolase activator NlpD